MLGPASFLLLALASLLLLEIVLSLSSLLSLA
jgi:hypothetical protein